MGERGEPSSPLGELRNMGLSIKKPVDCPQWGVPLDSRRLTSTPLVTGEPSGTSSSLTTVGFLSAGLLLGGLVAFKILQRVRCLRKRPARRGILPSYEGEEVLPYDA